MTTDYRQLVRQYVLDAKFVGAVFSGRRRGHTVPWKQVSIRPVLIRDGRHLQFSYLSDTQDVTKNYAGEAGDRLDELLALPFASIDLHTTKDALQIQITRRGKAIVHRHEGAVREGDPRLEHDHQKDLPLPVDKPDPFLQAIGIMTQEGKIRARMQRKFRQINEFLKLASETGAWDRVDGPITIVDCGCGSAHLTFATYHYLDHVLGVPARVTGIDVNQALIERQAAQSRSLGWDGLTFHVTPIIDYRPATPPSMVLALHACDTATDEALAQAVRWESRTILSVPCCHHYLQQQMRRETAPQAFRPVLRDGILRERLGDILTDAFRAQILRILGYRTDVIEFISTQHTAKNLMIRAVRSSGQPSQDMVREYEALKAMWGVEPYLAGLLADWLAEVR